MSLSVRPVRPVVASLPRPPSGVAHLFLNVLGSEVLRYTVGARHLRVSSALLCHAPVRRTRAASARYTGELPRRPRPQQPVPLPRRAAGRCRTTLATGHYGRSQLRVPGRARPAGLFLAG